MAIGTRDETIALCQRLSLYSSEPERNTVIAALLRDGNTDAIYHPVTNKPHRAGKKPSSGKSGDALEIMPLPPSTAPGILEPIDKLIAKMEKTLGFPPAA